MMWLMDITKCLCSVPMVTVIGLVFACAFSNCLINLRISSGSSWPSFASFQHGMSRSFVSHQLSCSSKMVCTGFPIPPSAESTSHATTGLCSVCHRWPADTSQRSLGAPEHVVGVLSIILHPSLPKCQPGLHWSAAAQTLLHWFAGSGPEDHMSRRIASPRRQ